MRAAYPHSHSHTCREMPVHTGQPGRYRQGHCVLPYIYLRGHHCGGKPRAVGSASGDKFSFIQGI